MTKNADMSYLKMRDRAYTIRRYRPEDLNKLIQLAADIDQLQHPYYGNLVQRVIENLHMPNYCPEDNLLVVDTTGMIVGYADLVPELRIGRVVLSCLLHPEYRTQMVAKKLIERGIARAAQKGAKTIHTIVSQKNLTTQRVFSNMGFRPVRRFLELRLDLSKIRLASVNEGASQYRHLKPGEEDMLAQLQNRAFDNSWGYNPNTTEDILYLTGHLNFAMEDVIIACDDDRPVGYCWSKPKARENDSPNAMTGRIHMLGVDPNYRGRGLGKQLLLAGLIYLKTKNVRFVELTVDSDNKAACALYRSAGFEIWTSSLWYEKVIQ